MSDKPSFISGIGRNVFFAGLVSLFMDISSEMIYPLLPLFLTGVLGTTKTTVGIIEGIAEATASILKVFSGWIADRFGKKKLLMGLGYGISVVSRPVIAGASTWFEVLTARFIDRFGKGVRTAPRDAIIAESASFGNMGLAFGFHRSMDTIGAVIGPAAAFALLYFYHDGLRLVFYASAIPGLIAVALIVFFIKEKRMTKEEIASVPKLSISSFDGPFRHYMLVVAIFSLGNFADAFLILQAKNLGVTEYMIPVVYLLFNLVYAASSAPMGMLSDKIGIRKMVLYGLVSYAAVYFLVGMASTTAHIWILFPLYGVYKGMSEGSQRAYLALVAPPERKATAFGVYHTVNGLMLLPASIIAGVLWDTMGAGTTFFYGAAMGLVAAVVFSFSRIGKKRAA
ncbi:MAG: MFS transporter [Deltaproteobacteria bacterium]|nr:MFS transporter [Deltaproteobacteria bacterium]